jgi:hypothetical protein
MIERNRIRASQPCCNLALNHNLHSSLSKHQRQFFPCRHELYLPHLIYPNRSFRQCLQGSCGGAGCRDCPSISNVSREICWLRSLRSDAVELGLVMVVGVVDVVEVAVASVDEYPIPDSLPLLNRFFLSTARAFANTTSLTSSNFFRFLHIHIVFQHLPPLITATVEHL